MKPGDDTTTLPSIPESRRWDESQRKRYTANDWREIYLVAQAEAVVEYAKSNSLEDSQKDNLIQAFKKECTHLTTVWMKTLPEDLPTTPRTATIDVFGQYKVFTADIILAVIAAVKTETAFSFDEWYYKHNNVVTTAGLLYGLEKEHIKKEIERQKHRPALMNLMSEDLSQFEVAGTEENAKARKKRRRSTRGEDNLTDQERDIQGFMVRFNGDRQKVIAEYNRQYSDYIPMDKHKLSTIIASIKKHWPDIDLGDEDADW